MVLGYSDIGKLQNGTKEDAMKTSSCLYALIRQRQIDIDSKRKQNELVKNYFFSYI